MQERIKDNNRTALWTLSSELLPLIYETDLSLLCKDFSSKESEHCVSDCESVTYKILLIWFNLILISFVYIKSTRFIK